MAWAHHKNEGRQTTKGNMTNTSQREKETRKTQKKLGVQYNTTGRGANNNRKANEG